MKILEGQSTADRNKMLIAGGLGLVALISLYLAFFGGSRTPTTAKGSPTPRPSVTPRNVDEKPIPTLDEQDFVYQTTPIDYVPGSYGSPDPGRNIFAFYEPPPPCPTCATPVPPTPAPPKPTPTPTPFPFIIAGVNPGTVYAGSQGFRMEVNGTGFTPDTKIYFNQNQLPTSYVSPEKLSTNIPANFITQEGPRQIIVQNSDGKLYSDQFMWNVQAPPRPNLQYVGVIGRKRYNNDTAIFIESGKPTPFTARLNDVLGGRFRLINITSNEVTFEDVNLGFKHHVAVAKGPGGAGGGVPTAYGQPTTNRGSSDTFTQTYDPSSNIPGVPGNVPRYVPPQPQPPQPKGTPSKDDDIDDEDDGGPR
jgi:hypothetical protein